MKNAKRILQNEKGLATVETIPLLLLFVILLAYSFGSFGIIHTGILNSIAARTYAFETFRNRTSVVYFRDAGGDGSGGKMHYQAIGNRVHGIMQELRPGEGVSDSMNFKATERPLRIGFGGIPADNSRNTASIHNERIFTDVREQQQSQVGVSPAWIMTQYGICINAACGN